MNDETKSSLDMHAKVYIQELYERLISENLFSSDIDNTKSSSIKNESVKNASEQNKGEAKHILRQLWDLRQIAQVVYRNIEKSDKQPPELLSYAEYFNEKNITNIPLSDQSFRSLLENINNITDEDISGRWFSAIEKNKIDIRKESGRILEFHSRTTIGRLGEQFGFVLSKDTQNENESGFIVASSRDQSKLILFDVKFRTTIDDLKSIVLRETEAFSKFSDKDTNKYLAIIIYTNQQEHNFNRLVGQFNKIIVDQDEDLINKVFFLPISLYKMEDLDDKISDVLKSAKGIEVAFNYQDSPLNHNWKGDKSLSSLRSIFIHGTDPKYGNTFELNLPNSEGYNYIDYNLLASGRYAFRKVIFVVEPKEDYKFYIEISIKDDRKQFWLQIHPDEKTEASFKEYSNTEYIVFSPYLRDNNWKIIEIDVQKVFESTFKNAGLRLNRIEGVRFRGKIKIAKIAFE